MGDAHVRIDPIPSGGEGVGRGDVLRLQLLDLDEYGYELAVEAVHHHL